MSIDITRELDPETISIIEEYSDTLSDYAEQLSKNNDTQEMLRILEHIIDCAEELREALTEELAVQLNGGL